MRKPITLAAAAVAALAFAAPASATTIGGPVGAASPVSDDWNGHSTGHCNNLGSPQYYNNEIAGTGLIPGQQNADNGNSTYTIDPLAGEGSCGGTRTVTSTGYTNNPLPAPFGEYPVAQNDRNPDDGTSGFYVEVAGVSAGQKADTTP